MEREDKDQWPSGDLMAYKRTMHDRTGTRKVWWDGKVWEIQYRVADWEEYRAVLLEALEACTKAGCSAIDKAIFDRMSFQRCLLRINDYHFSERAGAAPDPLRFLGLPVELMERAFLAWSAERGGHLPSKGSSVLFAPPRAEEPRPDPSINSNLGDLAERRSIPTSGSSSSSGASSDRATATTSSADGLSLSS